MDGVQYQYIRLTKILLCISGQWFYLTKLQKILISSIYMPIVTGQFILQTGGMIRAFSAGDIDAFMEGVSTFFASCMCSAKLYNYIYNNNKMKDLLNVSQEDWKTHSKSENELEILCRNYAVAKRITVSYTACMYGTMTPFLAVPALLNAADAMGFYNITGERPIMFRVEHFVDTDKYYYPVLIHSYLSTLGFIAIVVGFDSLIMIYVQHECGLCEILGRRLGDIIDNSSLDVNVYPKVQHDKSYQNVKNCVILHQHIIEFAKHLEEANCTSYFFQLGIILIGITFTEVQAVVKLDNPKESFRYASFTVCLTSVLLLLSWPGQQLIDHTERIFQYTASSDWHLTSINARRLIRIMMLRSITPIKLTAGKLYILDLLSFSSVARTSFSYLTVLSSVQ